MKLNQFQFRSQHKRKRKYYFQSVNGINIFVFLNLVTRVPIVQLATFQIACQLENILFMAMHQILHVVRGVRRGHDHSKKVYSASILVRVLFDLLPRGKIPPYQRIVYDLAL